MCRICAFLSAHHHTVSQKLEITIPSWARRNEPFLVIFKHCNTFLFIFLESGFLVIFKNQFFSVHKCPNSQFPRICNPGKSKQRFRIAASPRLSDVGGSHLNFIVLCHRDCFKQASQLATLLWWTWRYNQKINVKSPLWGTLQKFNHEQEHRIFSTSLLRFCG